MCFQVGAPLVDIEVLGDGGEETTADQPVTPASTPHQPAAATAANIAAPPSAKAQQVLASPSARALAREHNLSLQGMTGTGSHGQITKQDIIAAVKSADVASKPGESINY